ncbi:uncharacterized protein LOC120897562 isoform X1 [Anopheles arabiensis]|uniref:Uncharacterized protein n=1 Tax=Anopheles arabiensis TaxID=7173 RepID=A0A182I4R9_ANOAR|nr:uncharacterized protein LOC120897562 isoform X1 [Anopheles arabiensis]
METTINPIRTVGKKVIVEYGGRIYSAPQQDLPKVSRKDSQSNRWLTMRKIQQHQQERSGGCYGSKEETKRSVSDTLSELSDSDGQGCTPKLPSINPAVSCSAAQVLSELKEEVTRLIDESIEKIEQNWTHSSKLDSEAVRETVPEPELMTEPVKAAEDLTKQLHPDGDRGLLPHREQNLQVLHTELFETSKQQTRMKLLNEIRDLVERLKDMETLE